MAEKNRKSTAIGPIGPKSPEATPSIDKNLMQPSKGMSASRNFLTLFSCRSERGAWSVGRGAGSGEKEPLAPFARLSVTLSPQPRRQEPCHEKQRSSPDWIPRATWKLFCVGYNRPKVAHTGIPEPGPPLPRGPYPSTVAFCRRADLSIRRAVAADELCCANSTNRRHPLHSTEEIPCPRPSSPLPPPPHRLNRLTRPPRSAMPHWGSIPKPP